MGGRKPLIAGNWKMFGRRADLHEVSDTLKRAGAAGSAIDIVFCPPATLLREAAEAARAGGAQAGAQDVSPLGDGAHTGDLSAPMLTDAGAAYCIVGHSERRADHGETDAIVAAKAKAAAAAGLAPILCVGETLAERESGQALAVVERQLEASIPENAPHSLVIAYEPVWAIGTGRTPTAEDIAAMHRSIRGLLDARFGRHGAEMRVLYGGSVKPANAAEIFAVEHVDGALVGGASLKAADFAAIILAHPAAAR
ncbi:MAG: triose-phosphate isomerase [Alphaproteobacteria bacterium]|nr:triose-phosphate isomerase [Alphaproteobacteria bacterium]